MDPLAILSTVSKSAEGALQKAGATASDVVGVGITNQRESTIVWDKTTGAPLYDAVLWHDARTAGTVASLTPALGGQDALRSVCGLPISTYFSGIKLRWLLDNVPAVKEVRSCTRPRMCPFRFHAPERPCRRARPCRYSTYHVRRGAAVTIPDARPAASAPYAACRNYLTRRLPRVCLFSQRK